MKASVKYLFDTDVISALMKGKPPLALTGRLTGVADQYQAISALTVFEVYYGAYRIDNPERFIQLFESRVLPVVHVIPFDDNAARIAGRIRGSREKTGRPIALGDLQIAATALSAGCILVTGNTRHFTDIPGLDQENWLV
jgi:predicted nucleic acid-binding protein